MARRSIRARILAALLVVAAAPLRGTAQDCSRDSVGCTPLEDLRAAEYHGRQGGLYPGGAVECPAGHLADGLDQAARVVPRDSSGESADDGRIVVLSIGFSFTSQIFVRASESAAGAGDLADRLVLVNGAFAGYYADRIADPASPYWSALVPGRLAAAGVSARQVQVVWLMEGLQHQDAPFPDHVDALADDLAAVARNVRANFPNARLCYVTPLHYLGYAVGLGATEPYYYEQAFAVQELVARQIAGDRSLAFADRGAPAPWLAWGPYLWCDGVEPRSDGLSFGCEAMSSDGIHLSDAGRDLFAARLLHFLRSEPTATPWSLAAGRGVVGRPASVELEGDGTSGSAGVPRLHAVDLPTIVHDGEFALRVIHGRPRASGLLLLGGERLPGEGVGFGGGRLLVPFDLVVPVELDWDGSGEVAVGEVPDDPEVARLDWHAQVILLDPRGLDGKVTLTSAIALRPGD